MYARLFLAWLAIAIIAVAAQKDAYNDDLEDSDGIPLKVRSALAEEALGVLHERGEDVDISLEGYDHDLVARELSDEAMIEGLEARDTGLDYEALRKLGRMKPHYVQKHARSAGEDDEDDEEDEDDDTPYVDLDPEDEDESEDEDGNDVTFANIVPDPAGDADELAQPPISERDVEEEDNEVYSEEVYAEDFDDDEDEDEEDEPGSYDSGLYARSELDPEDDEELDYSLEGYDPAVLRRGEDEEDDDDEFDEEDFDFHSFLSESPDSPASAWGAHVSERDLAADEDEDFDGSADDWASDEGRNARYDAPEPSVVLGKPLQFKRDIVEEASAEDDEDEEGPLSRAWSKMRRWTEDLLT